MTMKYRNIIMRLLPVCLLIPSTVQAQQERVAADWMKKDSIVVTQLGGISSWKVAGAMSTVKGSKLEKSFTQNVMNTLYGEIPGLTVMQGSGEPGSDSPTMNARGFNTFSTTDRSVLVIVDGFESTFDQLAVQEIESITLLKDAAAAVVYGMRGANGVLLVTTKKGAVKPLEVNFSAQLGFNTPFRTPKYLDSYGYAYLYDEARVNDGLDPVYTGTDAMDAYKTGANPYLYPNVNWYDEVLKKSSILQNYDLNFSGGNETIRYFALLNVSDNNGFFKGTDRKRETSSNSKYTRYNIRANVDVNITEDLSAEMRLAANIQDQSGPAGGAWNVYNKLSLLPPNAFPVRNPNGTFGGNATFSNPVGDLTETGYNSYNARNIQSNLRIRYDLGALTKGLSVSAAFSFNNYFIGHYNKSKKYPYYALAMSGDEYVYNEYSEKTPMSIDDSQSDQWRNTTYEATIDYSRIFGSRHSVDANVAFFTQEMYKLTDSTLRDSQFPYKNVGIRGRVSYGYDQRYVGEVAFAYEGSDLYARGSRFGLFPAVSLGWIASNEEFLKGNDLLTFLKVRGSYGTVGNAAIADSKRYADTQDYKYSAGYYKGATQTTVSGLMEDVAVDPDRTWESEKRLNIGVDATLWNNLDVSLDYFRHKRSDILVSPTGAIPGLLGMTFSTLNMGKTTNKGFEASLRYSDAFSNGLEYYAQGNFWYAKNKIDYMAEEYRTYSYQSRTGQALDQGFGLVALGLFRDEDDIKNSPTQTFGEVCPGDIKYKDMNGDNQIDDQDACPIGYTGTPQYSASLTLGLKYKGFDFETMLYGVGNRTVYLSGSTYWAFQNQYAAPESALYRWTEATKETAIYPRLSTQANPNNTKYSSFWQKNGSFLKLRYVEVGYTLPEKWSKAVYADKIRFFLNGTNLFSLHHLHDMSNADPEGLSGVPAMRTVSAGVKLQF